MPPIGLHMILGRELARELSHPAIEADRGAFYLGTSAPDINVLTRWERPRTHFFDLADYGEQDGVEGLFRGHPGLADPRRLNSSTAAFLAGYVSHLVVDEAWINDIYRPCFGRRSPLGGSALANVMDRLLQFELYRREQVNSDISDEIRSDLLRSALEIEVDLIDDATLRRWRDIAVEVLEHPADWQRFGLIASRFLKTYGVETAAQFQAFLKDVPELLRRTERHVTAERVERFLENSRLRSLEAIREYLR